MRAASDGSHSEQEDAFAVGGGEGAKGVDQRERGGAVVIALAICLAARRQQYARDQPFTARRCQSANGDRNRN